MTDYELPDEESLVMPGVAYPRIIYLFKKTGGSWRYPKLAMVAEVKVDKQDLPSLSKYRWCMQTQKSKDGLTLRYAFRMEKAEGRTVKIFLHREVAGLKRGDKREVLFKDGDGLNCQRANLQIVPRSNHRGFRLPGSRKRTDDFREEFPPDEEE